MSSSWSGALAGVGLAALVMGCGGAPEPAAEPAAAPEAVQAEPKPAQAAVPEPVRAAAKSAKDPWPAYPEDPRADDVPGDGKMFPLTVTVVSGRTGKPMHGFLGPSPRGQWTHPKAARHLNVKAWVHHETYARTSFPTFPPCLWDFVLVDLHGLEIRVETAIWTQPPGGEVNFEIEDFEWTGRVLDAEGRPVPHAEVQVLAKGLRPHKTTARYVRYLSIHNRGKTDAEGRFRLHAMHTGRWMVTFETTVPTASGGQRTKRVRRFLEIKPGQDVVLQPRTRSN